MHQQKIYTEEHTFIAAATAAATTLDNDVTLNDGPSQVDCAVNFGATVTADANSLLKVYQADVSDYSDKEEVTALTTTIIAGMASKHVTLSLVRPTKKYIRFSIIRGGGSDSIIIAGGFVRASYGHKLPVDKLTAHHTRTVAVAPAS